MDKRLKAISESIDPCKVFADVGCDHGTIAKYVLTNNLAEKIIASDISAKCLDKARALIGEQHGNRVEFIECDGIAYRADTCAICGMGGDEIARIIIEAKHKPQSLILMPHTRTQEVRITLVDQGYEITADTVVESRKKFYTLIKARLNGRKCPLNALQLEFGTFIGTYNPPLIRWLKTDLKRLTAVAKGKAALEKLGRIKQALALQDSLKSGDNASDSP